MPYRNRALQTRFSNAKISKTSITQRSTTRDQNAEINNQRSKRRDEQWRRKKQQCKNSATQAPILTKPRRRKLQAMEIELDVWFLTAAPVEERSNDAKTQQPMCRFWPNPGSESFRRWKSDRTCGFSPPLQWRRRTRWSGEWVWFVLYLICSWVFGA